MSFPDKCPNCGANPTVNQFHIDRRGFACGSWIIKSHRGNLENKSATCDDWRTIKDATAVIRAFLEGDRDAREKGFNWIAENTP